MTATVTDAATAITSRTRSLSRRRGRAASSAAATSKGMVTTRAKSWSISP